MLTLIFDSRQFLYGFNSANPSVAENFHKIVPDVQTGHIKKNYRSPKQLVILSNLYSKVFRGLIEVEPSVPHLGLGLNCLEVEDFDNPTQEVNYTANSIRDLHNDFGVNWGDIVILARTNKSLRDFEAGLISCQVPYNVKYDSRSILNQSAFKVMFSIYSLLVNPQDLNALLEIMIIMKGIGKKFIDKLRNYLVRMPSLDCFTLQKDDFKGENSKQFQMFYKFLEYILKPTREIFKQHPSFLEFNKRFFSLLESQVQFDGEEKLDPRKNFYLKAERNYFRKVSKTFHEIYLGMADEQDFKRMTDIERFQAVYQNLQLSLDVYGEIGDKNSVTLSTIHSFKGKQADYVYFTHLRGLRGLNINDYDEQCCFYVAVTRAKKKLFLFSSDLAYSKEGRLMPSLANPFLDFYTSNILEMKRILEEEGNI